MANNNNHQAAPVAEQTISQSEAFFLKYKKAIIGAVIALVVIIAGIVLYKTYVSGPKEIKASTAIAKGQEYFAASNFEMALNGDNHPQHRDDAHRDEALQYGRDHVLAPDHAAVEEGEPRRHHQDEYRGGDHPRHVRGVELVVRLPDAGRLGEERANQRHERHKAHQDHVPFFDFHVSPLGLRNG